MQRQKKLRKGNRTSKNCKDRFGSRRKEQKTQTFKKSPRECGRSTVWCYFALFRQKLYTGQEQPMTQWLDYQSQRLRAPCPENCRPHAPRYRLQRLKSTSIVFLVVSMGPLTTLLSLSLILCLVVFPAATPPNPLPPLRLLPHHCCFCYLLLVLPT